MKLTIKTKNHANNYSNSKSAGRKNSPANRWKGDTTITKDSFNKGRYCGSFGVFGCCNNSRYPDTVEFVTDCIERHFANFGLNVEFK